MARKQSKRIPLDGTLGRAADRGDGSQSGGLTHNPFAALRARVVGDSVGGDSVQESPGVDARAGAPAESEARSRGAGALGLEAGATLIVRHERKGHGGKTVTVIDLSRAGGSSKATLESLAKDLRKALGAGARAGDQEIVVQGDLVERVARFLEDSHGARVILGTR
ncbi:translation initiation factor Sui1 [Planctomycetes bacterium Poly30]|uniref:Translation initiation factor Sui1 n=1 Tax=Saltatorellus ferox TaxID=2528018 RepID=A0A518ESI2_9BACT|nr:translation initiation factor Sui1 [Planctomycetes bacterium Poly30]